MEDNTNSEGVAEKRPPIPRLVALGLNHALCVTKSLAFRQGDITAQGNAADSSAVVDATLHVHSWGKGTFNCLGHGVNVHLAKAPKSIHYFERKNVSQVACGDYHSAVLVLPNGARKNGGGTVFTFGLGTAGRLGYDVDNQARQTDSNHPDTPEDKEDSWCTTHPQPVGLSMNLKHNVVSLACGANHTLVTTVDGSLFSWGMGAFGVLGTGNCQNQYNPVRIRFPVETFMTTCAAGCRHSFGVDDRGQIWAWGYGGNGRLGTGDTRSQYAPKVLQALEGTKITQVSCGDSHSACVDVDGKVYTWGSSKCGKLGHKILVDDVLVPTLVESLLDTKIVQVECGTGTTLALSDKGTVYQWGAILGFVLSSSDTLPYIANFPREVPEAGHKNVYIAAGPYSCASVTIYGDLKTWGVGSCFRLGHGNVTDYVKPKFVAELRSGVYVDGIISQNKQAQQKTEDTPKDVRITANERRIRQLSVGLSHGALLTCNGTIYTWGACSGTGFSNDPETTQNIFTGDLRARGFPEHIYTLECAINVFAGLNNSCCITTTKHDNFINDEVGTAWVFGSASGGKLGLGEKCNASVIMAPRKINYVSGVYKVVLGHTHSLLLQHEGVIYATGSGADGKLGTGEMTTLHSFTRVKTDLKFIDIAVGASHSLAISMTHDLYGWGLGKYITKGSEAVVEPVMIDTLPSQVGIAKVHAVVAFAYHSLVLTDQGHLIAWGDNSSGQLGVPTMTKDPQAVEFIEQPSLVLIDSPVTSVATSRSFSACMTLNGDAYAWGLSSEGRLGIGETHNKVTYQPTAMATINLMGDMLDSPDNVALHNDLSSYATAVESFIDELHFRDDKDVVDWKGLQILLKNEERVCWEASLKAFEDDLVKCLKQHVDVILEMDKYHEKINSLKIKLEVAIQGFVNKLGNAKPPRTPTNINEFTNYTSLAPHIEQFVETIFLQPAYFVRLCLFGNDITTVENMVTYVYSRLDIPRVHNQYVAMLMALLREEIQLFFNPQTPLNASISPFARMLRAYTTTKYISASNAMIFYSPECSDSFHNFMKQYTLVLPNRASPKSEELGNFAKFIIHLNKILSVMVVPKYVKIAFKRMHNMIKFKIPAGWALPDVPLENVAIYPLIPTFVYAVLQPYFSNAEVLSGLHGYTGIDKAVSRNFATVAEYFEYIVNPSLKITPSNSHEVNRVTMSFYRNISQMLLEYIKTLLVVEDTFNIDLTMETFKTHFDMDKLRVDIPSWVVAQFLNVCTNTKKYLNLSAHDPVCKLLEYMLPSDDNGIKKQRIFEQKLIQKLMGYEKTTSVQIEHRFLMFDKTMSICRFSGVFLPQRLAYRQTTYSEECIKLMSLVMRYVAFGKYDPLRVIQNALSELTQIDAAPGGFETIMLELQNLAECYTLLPVPDYAAANRARDAYAQLMTIDRTRTTPCDVAANILKKVLERQQHRKYLLRVYQRQGEIEISRIHFEAAYRDKCQYIALCINHATKLFVEPRIQNAAISNRVKLYTGKLSTAKSRGVCESAAFNLSTLQKMGQIVCKRDEDIQRLDTLYLLFQFNPKHGCLIRLQEQPDGTNEMVQRDKCDVPLDAIETWSQCTDDSCVEMFPCQKFPQGIFGIRKKFLAQTFSQLME
ncbi:regulator of chromosome condensation domain-containing, putative [Babesia ovis]|uniref:Regulator of chromosome condensation domain-containing, putative n=1 Tax=Babesia ovis TaxID=5869 RepID=A0A9W5TDM0_BABOV|nr:regulator of chromosome condensation domain-containing, putative [Babesia ovis]